MTTFFTPWSQRLGAGLRALWPARSSSRVQLPPIGQAQAGLAVGGWQFAWASLAGPHHCNQDCAGVRWLHGNTLALGLADGVTLAAAGDVAAYGLVDYWTADAPSEDFAARTAWLAAADEHVRHALKAHTSELGAATGAAVWLQADGQRGWATRIGDCRVLLARYGEQDAPSSWTVRSLFADQTLGLLYPHIYHKHHIDADQPAYFAGCQRLGIPEAQAICVQPAELLFLASDGLHAYLSPAEWHRLLSVHMGDGFKPPPVDTLHALCRDLVQTAKNLGSEDDITVLVVSRKN